ncbi:S8 family peptidase [Alkalinema sp. FACHB-956]|uniref:S8 family peptidase n=1 Tax=Alkalinema sp. FACHB-956 TaxID=2692768 RepID=UPI0018EF5279|nr:S8 family peptidase [Alkalinema sp. FACHB-956]
MFVLTGLLTGSSSPTQAQDCSTAGAYLQTSSGQCLDLSGLQQNSSTNNTAPKTTPLKTYIVTFQRNAIAKDKIPGAALEMAQKAGGKVEFIYQETIQGTALSIPEPALQGLRQNPLVASIEVDQMVQVVGKTSSGTTATTQPPQEVPWGITRMGSPGNGTGKTAWVIDTGIDLKHPDLKVDASRCFTAFTSGTEGRLGCNDGNGHGTHVAGTIAALNNSIGVVGVAAGATVVPVKVLDSNGGGTMAGVIAGVDAVAARAKIGDVANMSLGGGASDALDNAVKLAAAKGIKFAVAAGNEAQNANNVSPARANGANIYTISAFDASDRWASFSNYGNPPIDYAAPGVNIKSTWKGGTYNTISGTSMATPHAAGVLLLGVPVTSGVVLGDPDGMADPIIHR